MGIIYQALNVVTGKSYVGQTVQSLDGRRRAHVNAARAGRGCRLFKNALRKHGSENFVWSVLAECSSQEEMNRVEELLIETVGSLAPEGYNLSRGGDSGGKKSEEARAHMRAVFARPEVKAKRSKAQKEVHSRSEVLEACRKIWLGKKRSVEDRKKMSANKLVKRYRWKLDPTTGQRIYWSEAK